MSAARRPLFHELLEQRPEFHIKSITEGRMNELHKWCDVLLAWNRRLVEVNLVEIRLVGINSVKPRPDHTTNREIFRSPFLTIRLLLKSWSRHSPSLSITHSLIY